MAISLINNATGQPQLVRDDEAQAAVISGAFSFQPGMEIPVRHPETGEVQPIPSENMARAFKSGYTLPTSQEQQASSADRAAAAYQQNVASHPLTAAAQGALSSASFGLSDAAMAGLQASGALPAGLTTYAEDVNKASPIAHTLGEVAGFLAPTGAGSLITKAGEKAGGLAAGEALAKLAPSVAKNIVAKAANRAVGSAVEGALITGQQAITEASLGDPNEVAEHFLSNLATGVLVGGGLGAGLPIAGVGLKAGRDLVGRGVRAVGEKVEGSVMDLMFGASGAKREAAEGLKELDTKVFRDAEAAKNASKEVLGQAQKELDAIDAKQAKADNAMSLIMKDEAKAQVEGAKELEKLPVDAISKLGIDTDEAVGKIYDDMEARLGREVGPAVGIADKVKSTLDGVISMLSEGTQAEKNFGIELRIRPFINVPVNDPTSVLGMDASAAITARRMLDKIKVPYNEGTLGALKGRIRNEITGALKGYTNVKAGLVLEPVSREIAEIVGPAEKVYEKWNRVNDLVDKVMRKRIGDFESVSDVQKAVGSLRKNPELESDLVRRMGNFAEALPEGAEKTKTTKLINDYMASRANTLAKEERFKEVTDLALKIRTGEASTDALPDMLRKLGVPERRISSIDAGKQGRILRDVRAKLGPDASPLDIIMNVAREAGEDIPQQYKDLAPLMPHIEKMHVLQKAATPGAGGIIGGLPGAMAGAMGGTLGATLAGPYGAMVGAAAGRGLVAAGSGLMSPLQAVHVFRTIDRVGHTIRNATAVSTEALINGLTGKAATKAATVAQTSGSIKERRDIYLKQRENLSSAQDKIAALKNNIASQISPSAPKVAAAMAQKLDITHQFLESKMPQDPLTQTSVFANKTGYVPPDADLAKWERYVKAVDNPTSVIDEMAHGAPSQEGIETLKTCYPTMFKQLQSEVLSAIMEKQSDLTFKQKVLLGNLFDIPSDPSLASPFVSMMQGNFVQKNNGEQGGRPPKATTNSKKLAEAVSPLTDNQRVQYK